MLVHSFDIVREADARTCVAHMVGDVDSSVVPDVMQQLGVEIRRGCSNVVLDLAEVTYADSSALGLLVWLDRQLTPVNGRLVLAGANPDVQRILELSGLVSVAQSIGMTSDVEGALAGLDLTDVPSELLWHEEFEVPADVNRLAEARERVCDLVAPLGFPEAAVFDIKVALGEALANAVRHGSAASDSGSVEVGVSAYGDRVVLDVRDRGVGFDGTLVQSDDVYAPGGRGIMFMRALMDRVEFEQPNTGGTRVRLVKHRNGSAA